MNRDNVGCPLLRESMRMAETAQSGGGATPGAKLCGTCGQDCAGKPRAKDPKGNYMCMECVDRAKAARDVQQGKTKPTQTPTHSNPATVNLTDETDNSFLLTLGEAAPTKADENKRPCPNCFKKVHIDSVICINCGFNAKSGEQLHVRVLKPKNTKSK